MLWYSNVPEHILEKTEVIKKRSRETIKTVLNRNFTFADLSPRFKNVDSSTGNIFCPFHENRSTPAAKMYWDENREIWVLWCFTEHKHYTAFDYVNLILCERYEKYKSPLDFLRKNMSLDELYPQLDASERERQDLVETYMDAKVEHIMQVAEECETLEDYIEKLYLA